MAEADQIIAEAREHATRLREESERELTAATLQRDNINAQLGNVRQMLASFGMGAVPGVTGEQMAAAEVALEAVDEAAEEVAEAAEEAAQNGKVNSPK